MSDWTELFTELGEQSEPINNGENWVFTAWTVPDPNMKPIKFLCWGEEKCPVTGKKHFQGYVEFLTKKEMYQVKSIFKCKDIYFDKAHSNRSYNVQYCLKSKGLSYISSLNGTSRETIFGSDLI